MPFRIIISAIVVFSDFIILKNITSVS